jgi:hypothetical protein
MHRLSAARRSLIAAFGIAFPCLFSVSAFGSPLINGLTFSGTVTDTAICLDPSDNETSTGGLQITITSQSGNLFTGNLIAGDSTGTIAGTVNDDGSLGPGTVISGQDADGTTFGLIVSGGFSPVPSPNTFAASFTGSDSIGCTLNGTFNLTTGQVTDPTRAPASEVVAGAQLNDVLLTGVIAQVGNYASITGNNGSFASLNERGGRFSTRGMAAGGHTAEYGVWGSVAYNRLENDFVSTRFDSDRYDAVLGVDMNLSDTVIAGIALGLERTDTDTDFNRGNQVSDGITVTPYVAATFTDALSVNAAFGYTSLDIDQDRTDPTTSTRIQSSLEADRWFVVGFANYTRTFDNINVLGRGGISFVRQSDDAFTESDGTERGGRTNKIGRFHLGGEVAYAAGAWEPFASALFNYSYTETNLVLAGGTAQPGDDKSDVLFGLGVRYYGANGMSGTLEYNTLLGADDIDSHSLNLIFRTSW